MQLLVRYDTRGYGPWRSAFDADTEDRMQAGLTLLQLWRDTDSATTAWALFETNDRGKAEDWLAKETGLGARITPHFLSTA